MRTALTLLAIVLAASLLAACGDNLAEECAPSEARYLLEIGPGTGDCDATLLQDGLAGLEILVPAQQACGETQTNLGGLAVDGRDFGCSFDLTLDYSLTPDGPDGGLLLVNGGCSPGEQLCSHRFDVSFTQLERPAAI